MPAYSIKNIKHICNGQARKTKVGGEEGGEKRDPKLERARAYLLSVLADCI